MSPDISEWNSFVRRIQAAKQELGMPEVVWYRGVANDSYSLRPSLMRINEGIKKEELLFNKYRQIAASVLQARQSDWEYLFDMQHHYIPTRLLDWTEVLGVAVYFATLGTPNETAAVYVIDPLALNKKSGKMDIPMVNEDDQFDYKSIYWRNHPVFPTNPVAIEPPVLNARIQAQRAKFTIHGNDSRAIEDLVPDCVKKVTLNRDAKRAAGEFLKMAGISEFSMFPDIVGMVPFFRRIVGV